ncbi:MAG TPA: gluconate:H+ symporter [Acidobacteriaceae bacterium]|nr:gluconate:H+ symporter [Acidobacteriaceae bacterium]
MSPVPALDSHGIFLLFAAASSVIGLILLIAVGKLNPFLSLMVVSLALAAAAGMPLSTIVSSFETGTGNTLGHIAIIVGLGTMLGKMMAESGASERIAQTLIQLFGERNIPWSMMCAGLIVGLPVFFEVGFVLLVPIAFTVARRSNNSLIMIGLPMVAGLSVVHGLVPPHPAAMLAVTIFHADVGRTIMYALLVGIPSAVIAGPLYAKLIAPRIKLDAHNPMAEEFAEHDENRALPGFFVSLLTVLLPVLLMLLGSWAGFLTAKGSLANRILLLLGSADMALLVAVLVSFVTLGTMRGFNRATILKFCNDSLAPTAGITLVIGAGGGFGRILQDSGVSQAIVSLALHAHVSLLLLGWLVAALIRLATGSATVSLATAAGIVAPILAHSPGVRPELLAIATGAGSVVFSHVNDGGFWLVKEYFNMSVADTMKTWSISETLISIIALVLVLGLSVVL